MHRTLGLKGKFIKLRHFYRQEGCVPGYAGMYTPAALSLSICVFIGLLFPLRIASAQSHQITPWRQNHAGAVSLSFDDGYWSQVENGVPLLNARGLKSTFFLKITGMDVPWDQWRQLAEQGHEIGSHTVNHPWLTEVSDEQLRYELSESQRVINQNVPSQSCITLAYPGNLHDSRVEAVASEYYIASRGGYELPGGGSFNYYVPTDLPNYNHFEAINFNAVASDGSIFDVPISAIDARLDQALEYSAWYVMYLHNVPGDTYYTNHLATVLDHIVARDLWVATFGDVAKYMHERYASTLSVLSSDTSAIRLDLANLLDGSIYNEPLTIRSVVPSTWLGVNIAQEGASTFVDSVVEGADRVVYYDAVPNHGTITLSSEPPTLTSISVSPPSASVGVGGTQQFTATAKDQYGDAMVPQPSFTWTVSGGGTIDNGGLFTAGGTPGGPFTVTATSGGVNGTATVTAAGAAAQLAITQQPVGGRVARC